MKTNAMITDKLRKITFGTIIILFCAITFCLSVGYLNISVIQIVLEASEKLQLVRHNFLGSLLKTAIGAFLFIFLMELLKNVLNTEKRAKVFIVICAVIAWIESIIWTKEAMFYPVGDPMAVWKAALQIVSGEQNEIDFFYFSLCPHQRSMVLMMLPSAFLGASHERSWLAFKVFNSFFVFGIVVIVAMLTYKIRNRKEDACRAAFICTLFSPIAMYSAYVYGTIMSLFFILFAFYQTLLLMDRIRFSNVMLLIISIVFACMAYSAAAVSVIAIIIILSLFKHNSGDERENIGKEFLKRVIVVLALVVVALFVGKVSGHAFEKVTDSETNPNCIPTSGYIMMGLTSNTEFGPGSYDGSHMKLLFDCDCDKKVADRIGKSRIKSSMIEFIRNPQYLVNFFGKKIVYQWLDPTFSAINQTAYVNGIDEVQVDKRFVEFLQSKEMQMIIECLRVICLIVYFGSFVFVFSQRTKSHDNKILLMALYFIGGFILQIFWESKSRYCFPYFVAIIPYAAVQIDIWEEKLRNVFKKA